MPSGRVVLAAVVLSWIPTSMLAEPGCRPVDGLEALLRAGNVLVLGELHGTAESPAFALDVACHAVQAGLPLVFGLELPPGDGDRLRAFLDSEGDGESRRAQLAKGWAAAYQDGRRSQAMFRLLDGTHCFGGDLQGRIRLSPHHHPHPPLGCVGD